MDSPASLMVVDDMPKAAGRLAQSLRRLGYEVVVAFSAQDALDVVEERELQLVLVQAQLGHDQGLWLCRRLNWRRPDVAVVAVTHANDRSLAGAAREAGAYDLIVAPWSDGELCFRVERALKRRELERRLSVLREVAASWSEQLVPAH